MAKTGRTFVPIGSGRRSAGMPEVEHIAEGSANTFIAGAAVLYSAGYIDECGADPTLIYGFALKPGANSASDGANKVPVDRALPGKEFVGSLNATLTQAMFGSVCNLVASASTWYLETATSISSVAQCLIKRPALGYAVGDTDPLVIFTVEDSKIQYL